VAKHPPSLQVVRRFFLLSSLPESKGVVSALGEDEVVVWEQNGSEERGLGVLCLYKQGGVGAWWSMSMCTWEE
jgi:hypothetical protein